MSTSRKTRLKSEKYNANITKRGNVPVGAISRREAGSNLGPIMLGFLVFVVLGSTIFQIIRNSQAGPIF